MNIGEGLLAFLYGAVQAATEFLPVSSSGHLVILHQLVPLSAGNDLAFDVALHLGTLGALVIVFYRDISTYSIAFFRSFTNWNVTSDTNQRLSWLIVAGTVPAGIVGVLIGNLAESLLRSTMLVGFLLISIGLLFFPIEKLSEKKRTLGELRLLDVLLIGFAQALAFFPGVSRSGATLLTGFARGLTRESAARFSFLLAIPITVIAGVKGLIDLLGAGISGGQLVSLVLGFGSSLGVGILVIRYFLRYVRSRTLIPFAWYRIILGLGVVVFTLLAF